MLGLIRGLFGLVRFFVTLVVVELLGLAIYVNKYKPATAEDLLADGLGVLEVIVLFLTSPDMWGVAVLLAIVALFVTVTDSSGSGGGGFGGGGDGGGGFGGGGDGGGGGGGGGGGE